MLIKKKKNVLFEAYIFDNISALIALMIYDYR